MTWEFQEEKKLEEKVAVCAFYLRLFLTCSWGLRLAVRFWRCGLVATGMVRSSVGSG